MRATSEKMKCHNGTFADHYFLAPYQDDQASNAVRKPTVPRNLIVHGLRCFFIPEL